MSFILFLLLLSAIIIIHEGGHFLAAKCFGVYCHEFSIGMGPKIFSKKGKETTFSIRALPVGGFVAMAGDNDNALETEVDVEVPEERTLTGIAKWKRIIIMLAGVFMNFILAVVIVSMILLHTGAYATSPKAIVDSVQANSPAERAGLLSGDEIVSVGFGSVSVKPKEFNDMIIFLYSYEGDGPVQFVVNRNGEIMNFSIEPVFDENEQRYLIGIVAPQAEIVSIDFLNCWGYGTMYCISMIRTMWNTIAQLFHGVGLNNLSGPIGIYQATDQAVSMGFESYLLMVALISLNVGLMNVFPLPILDGGRVFLVLVEAIIGHPISKKMEEALMGASTILILALFIFVCFSDLLRIF